MTKRSVGSRSGTRKKFSKSDRKEGITKYVRTFETGEPVIINIEPSSHKGMPFRRFQGKSGKVLGQRGRAFLVGIKDIQKEKTVIARPEHLKKV